MESCLLTIIDALRTNVLVCFMMILNNIVEADSFLNIALFIFIRLTFYMYMKKRVSAKIYYNRLLFTF